MSSRVRSAIAALCAAVCVLIVSATAFAAPVPRRVVIVLAPYLTWQDVMAGPMPITRRIASGGLVADMNDRSGAGTLTGATPSRGALMLSAGASMIEDPTGLSAFNASESVGAAAASDLYRQYFGSSTAPAAVLYVGQPQQTLVNTVNNPGPVLGELGNAAHAARAFTAAVGCSDPGIGVDVAARSRPAGIVAADDRGDVDSGDVSEALLASDVAAPCGARTDIARLRTAFRAALAATGPGRGSLIVVDPGDIARSYAAANRSTTPVAAAQHARAVRELDEVIGFAHAGLTPADTLMIVPSTPAVAGALAPLIVSGPLGAGLATSASTHREGIVTLPDVSASVVGALGGAVPPAVVGSPIQPSSTDARAPLSQRVGRLQQMATTAVAVEGARVPLLDTYVELAVLVLAACALVLLRGEPLASWTSSLCQALLLLLVCIPLAAILQFALVPYPTGRHTVEILLALVSAGLAAGIWFTTRRRPATWPLIAAAGMTTLLLLVDQWFGAPLSWASIFDYSPLQGARYYGIGNQMAGLLLGSALVTAALVLDTWRDARWASALRRWGWPVLALIVVGTAAAPTLGANFGPVAWMTVGFLAGWLILNGQRVWTWRNLLIALGLVVVVLGGFSVIDVLRGPGAETHLGRLVGDIGQSGLGSLWVLLARKAVTNVRVLGQTRWTWLAAAVLLLPGYMLWRPQGEFAAMLRDHPAFSAAVAAALFSSVTGYLTEDSGIIIPALVLMPVCVAALYLMLARLHGAGARSEAT